MKISYPKEMLYLKLTLLYLIDVFFRSLLFRSNLKKVNSMNNSFENVIFLGGWKFQIKWTYRSDLKLQWDMKTSFQMKGIFGNELFMSLEIFICYFEARMTWKIRREMKDSHLVRKLRIKCEPFIRKWIRNKGFHPIM